MSVAENDLAKTEKWKQVCAVSENCLEIIGTVNRCQIGAMEKAGRELDPSDDDSCAEFGNHVSSVKAAIIHTYALVACAAIREKSPEEAAALWRTMVEFCDDSLRVLRKLKDLYPHCGTPELYDLTLDYRQQAQERYLSNSEDSQCQIPIPAGLFPKLS
jgi:hypothetical protein